jgi:predicted metal-dependent hydrolase
VQPVPLKYLRGYPEPLQAQVRQLLADGGVAPLLRRKYPALHGVRTDRALYDYVMDLKASYLRSSEPLAKVCFDGKLQQVAQALGTHTVTARVQGSKLKTRREIRVATVFREAPEPFLKMITVHELAHLKKGTRQGLLQPLHPHGARLPPARVRRAAVPDPPGRAAANRPGPETGTARAFC